VRFLKYFGWDDVQHNVMENHNKLLFTEIYKNMA